MSKTGVDNIRNVVLCGHGSAGKTTLLDHLLVKTGASTAIPSVDAGTSLCDFDPEEKHHKYSIEAHVAHFNHAGKRFNVIDTPGYPDFIGQVIGALRGADLAVIVVNAHSGIEVNTRRVFQEAGKAGLPRMILINKMDTDNIDFPALLDDMRELWGKNCVALNVPVGSGASLKGVVSTLHVPADVAGALVDPRKIHDALVESVIEVDNAVMERYLEGQPPTPDEMASLLKKAVLTGALVPVLCAAGKQDVGVMELLDFIAAEGPSPADVPRVAQKDGVEAPLACDPNGPLAAQVFRTRVDPFVQKLSFLRVFSGSLKRDQQVACSTARKGLKIGPVFEVCGKETHEVPEASAGDIVALAKMEDLHTGASLGEYVLPPLRFPTPMVGLAVSPRSRGDETKLSSALHKVVEEDPTFHLDRDAQTKELVMTGMSELHLTIVRERLARRDKLEIDTKEPKIPFRETIQTNSEDMHRHKKQTGGRGQFGEVHIRMFPFPRGTAPEEFVTKDKFPSMKEFHFDADHNFVWINSIVGGTIPGNFLPAIEKGFKERLEGGVIAGYRVQDVAVEVYFGKYHDVDSSEAAFKTAGRMVFKKAFERAKPCLLEPVVKMEITIPEANVGDVYSDMSGRGGRVVGSDSAGGNLQTVRVEAPLRVVSTYARTLSSMTGGQGSFTMDFSHYDAMPANVQQEIMAKAKLHEEEEE